MKTLSQFWIFLKEPKLLKLSKNKTTLKSDFLWLLLLDIAFALIVSVICFVLEEFKFIKNYKESDLLKEFGIYGMFLFGCILAPLLEECLFRWHLRRRYASIYFVFLSFSALIISFVATTWICFLIFFTGLTLAIISEFYLKRQSQTKKNELWRRSYPIIFYFTAFVFGFVHLSNFEGLTIQDPAFIIYISSQIFGGLTLGYLRIKYGLKYVILFHACFNLIALTLTILFPNI